ncbi:hypothetical protein BJX63DRAFT_395759 [Aspergillus granulosus]|uniref:Uncharacterized protein n=1 Tax=Aspergillus granulosus TaxID=176169 RepID=A0ABR4HBM3_9EURO
MVLFCTAAAAATTSQTKKGGKAFSWSSQTLHPVSSLLFFASLLFSFFSAPAPLLLLTYSDYILRHHHVHWKSSWSDDSG